MREPVYYYLDLLFSKCKVVDNSEMIKVTRGKEIICKINLGSDSYPKINFSHSEFSFIKNMFAISEGDTVEFIRDYLSENFVNDFTYYGFFPSL